MDNHAIPVTEIGGNAMDQVNVIEFHGTRKSLFSAVASVGIPLFLLSVVFLLMRRIDPSWIYSCIGWVDAWAYFGHAVDPIGMRSAFPDHPSGDLLPLIWPAALLYSFFPAVVANLIYKWASFALAGLLLYRMVERDSVAVQMAGFAAGFLTAIDVHARIGRCVRSKFRSVKIVAPMPTSVGLRKHRPWSGPVRNCWGTLPFLNAEVMLRLILKSISFILPSGSGGVRLKNA
jgi:hypothetical protein